MKHIDRLKEDREELYNKSTETMGRLEKIGHEKEIKWLGDRIENYYKEEKIRQEQARTRAVEDAILTIASELQKLTKHLENREK
jgi:hypothetical protein